MFAVAVEAALRTTVVVAVVRIDERRMTLFLLRLRVDQDRFEVELLGRLHDGVLLVAAKARRRVGCGEGRAFAVGRGLVAGRAGDAVLSVLRRHPGRMGRGRREKERRGGDQGGGKHLADGSIHGAHLP